VDIVYCKKMSDLMQNCVEKIENASNELTKRAKSIEHRTVKKRTKPKKMMRMN
jgi:hypothetical protein